VKLGNQFCVIIGKPDNIRSSECICKQFLSILIPLIKNQCTDCWQAVDITLHNYNNYRPMGDLVQVSRPTLHRSQHVVYSASN